MARGFWVEKRGWCFLLLLDRGEPFLIRVSVAVVVVCVRGDVGVDHHSFALLVVVRLVVAVVAVVAVVVVSIIGWLVVAVVAVFCGFLIRFVCGGGCFLEGLDGCCHTAGLLFEGVDCLLVAGCVVFVILVEFLGLGQEANDELCVFHYPPEQVEDL